MRTPIILGLAALLAAAASGATAQNAVPVQSFDTTATATINPNGPRTGANGTKFFNVEGASNGANATFGVADFAAPGFSTAAGITSLALTLTESDALFTAPGLFNVYLASGTGVATSGLKYDAAQTATGGIGAQLGTLYSLGTFSFNTTGNTNTGGVATYSLSLANTATQAAFLTELNSGTIRLALGADAGSPATAATFFGSTAAPTTANPNTPVVPVLSFSPAANPVPEASTTVSLGLLLALGLGGVAVRRRKAA